MAAQQGRPDGPEAEPAGGTTNPVRPLDERAFYVQGGSGVSQADGRARTASDPGEPGGEPLPATYHPGDIEPRIYTQWLEADVFAPDGRGSNADQRQQPFVIIEPPPNVTGALH